MDANTLLTYFRSKIQVMPNGCWEWMGARSMGGYGRIGESEYAHRFSCAYFTGSEVRGKHVHHLCENPPCVNPSHLVAITVRQHTAVTPGSTSYRFARVTSCPQGHPYDEVNGYTRKARQHRMCRKCHAIRNKAIANSRPKRKSTFTGVTLSRLNERWKVEPSVKGQKVFISYFDDEREAAYVYDQVILQFHDNTVWPNLL